MLNTVYGRLNRAFPALAYAASRRWYEFISRHDTGRHLHFLNYGYANGQPLELSPEDEPDRYCIQLYHRVAGAVDLAGRSVLEVGSGRGGGASYVRRYLGPDSVLGVDLAQSAVDFCSRHFDVPGLAFRQGNAEELEFADESFDALVNVESSFSYERPDRFFSHAARVLKPGGHFLYADLRDREQLDDWSEQLAATGLELVEEEDISAGVTAALDLDSERRSWLIDRYAPWWLRGIFAEFAGVRGTAYVYRTLKRGEKVYKRFVFRK